MQDRYAGDIGDYIKLALLRHLSPGRKLGIAWYLYPDENHNTDGKHTAYLDDLKRWRHLDPDLFDALQPFRTGERSVQRLQATGVIDATIAGVPLQIQNPLDRSLYRQRWFEGVMSDLRDCDLVFADPDNGLTDDHPARRRQKTFGKRIPLDEVRQISRGRTAVIYHHNTRFPGGHDVEVGKWMKALGDETIAIRANAFSCRTFFVVNPDSDIRIRAAEFSKRWREHGVSLNV